MRVKVEARAMAMIEGLTDDAGNFLHHFLDADEHTEDEVKTLINAFPSALSHTDTYVIHDEGEDEDEDDEPSEIFMLPIQAAVLAMTRHAIPFIRLLAEEGMKLIIDGEGQRGGLLAEDNNGLNVLQYLAINASAGDSMSLDVLKRLRQSDLFKKEDIRQYDFLYWSCKPSAKEVFEYLINWDPKALKEYRYEDEPLLHANITDTCAIDNFAMALKAGLKHYPEELGFLFGKNDEGKTAFEFAFLNIMLKVDCFGAILRNVLMRLTMPRW